MNDKKKICIFFDTKEMSEEALERIKYNQSRIKELNMSDNHDNNNTNNNDKLQPNPISINVSNGSLTYNTRTPPIPINGNNSHSMMSNKYLNASGRSPNHHRTSQYSNNNNMTPSRYVN